MNNISPETLEQLHALAMQKIQADISADQLWMAYDPVILAVLGGIALLTLIVILVNEIFSHRVNNYDSDTRVYVNIAGVIAEIICLVALVAVLIAYMSVISDYNFKTKSPDAAAYQQVISYLYYGVSR